MKNWAGIIFCVARCKSGRDKAALLHQLWGKQNYQAFFVYR